MDNTSLEKLYEQRLAKSGLKLKRVTSLQQYVTEKPNGEKEYGDIRRRFDFYFKNKDTFFMTFCEFLGPLNGLSGKISLQLCGQLCKMAEYDTGIVNISTYNRQELCNFLGISKTQLSRAFNELKEKCIIKELGKGSYFINPLLFWKGDLIRRVDAVQDFYVEFVIVPKDKDKTKIEDTNNVIAEF